ncbi:hypothetical protein GF867_03500 [Aerococcaceae bacterium DSM 109652]|uniref:Uncharacterized protein n=1 Tax=Fundicoccus ignavus TaxID=2664442 RepID=A0A844BX67_9LACT|nr:hypothetical protein [Fundicoccus ignavus]
MAKKRANLAEGPWESARKRVNLAECMRLSARINANLVECMRLSASKFSQPLAKHEDERSVHDIE